MALSENSQGKELLVDSYMLRLPEHKKAFKQKNLAREDGFTQREWDIACGIGTPPLNGRRRGPLEEGEFKSFVEVNLGFPDRIERVIKCDIPEGKMIIPWECGD